MVFDDQIAPFPTEVRDTKLIHTVIFYNEKIFFFSNSQKPYIIHLYIYIYIYIHKSTRLYIVMG